MSAKTGRMFEYCFPARAGQADQKYCGGARPGLTACVAQADDWIVDLKFGAVPGTAVQLRRAVATQRYYDAAAEASRDSACYWFLRSSHTIQDPKSAGT